MAEFPDVPEALTNGPSADDAAAWAQDALVVALFAYIEDGRRVPAPSKARKGMRVVLVPPLVAAKLAIDQATRDRRLPIRPAMHRRMRLYAVHPGAILKEELAARGLSPVAFAEQIHAAPYQLRQVVAGRRPITRDLACRIGRAFGTSARFWIALQHAYDRSGGRARR